jgi:asparagine synthase (glutamine-hydrolysing)
MCGICGVYSFSKPVNDATTIIEDALQTLTKRGPEVQAQYIKNSFALGHSRLSIIDTTDAANQPFVDETGRYVLVFNGEIYNYRILRQQLQSKGYSFHTQSDTEVLIKWLMEKGSDGIQDLQGFFAFAFADNHTRTLLLARDRFGKKPLLYHQSSNSFLFASEMKAMIKLGIPKELDRESLQIYFQLNYIPGPWSIYRNVLKLMPGHCMKIEGKKIDIKQYYDIPSSAISDYQSLTYDKAMNLLRSKMDEAVVKRLVADVPLGAFLSGGIDSSIIVALAARHVKNLQTFSIGFKDEPMFDETRYARLVANMHSTEHTEFSLTTDDLLSCIYDVLDYTDEPFADSSALAVFILSRETRKKVTVALSGDGADEMFAGYNKHMAHFKAQSSGFDTQVLRILHPLLSVLPQSRNSFLGNKIRQMHRFGKGMDMPDENRYWRWAGYADEKYPSELLLLPSNEHQYRMRKEYLTRYVSQDGSINGILRNDMHLVLTNDMLTKVDMMSMANSLEVRVPFLDHDVVNLVFSMAENFKIDQHQRKKILKDAFREMLPAELYHRPKQGFEVPLLSWFRKELKDTILNDWLNSEYIEHQNIFNLKVINNLKKRLFSSNPGEIHAQIWSIAVFQYWYKKYHEEI